MSSAPVVVCVGRTPEMQKLIVTAAEYTRELGACLQVVNISRSPSFVPELLVIDFSLKPYSIGAILYFRNINGLSE